MARAKKHRVFISYSWESEEYKRWVLALAQRLRVDGIEARLDQLHLEEGQSVPEFMSSEIRKADRVLVLCSPGMQTKVHRTEDLGGMTGTGEEMRLLRGAVFSRTEGARQKGLAVLARGEWKRAAPSFLLGENYVDISDEATFEDNYRTLLRRITGRRPRARDVADSLPPDVAVPEVEPLRGPKPGEDDAAPADDGDVTLAFSIRETGDGSIAVELCVDGGEALGASLELDLESSMGQASREFQAIKENSCTADDIQNLGSELWVKIQGGDIEAAVARARSTCRSRSNAVLKVRLTVEGRLESWPWESLYDYDELSLATNPKTSLVRVPPGLRFADAPRYREERPLRVLLVIPADSGLSSGSEWEKIQQSVSPLGEQVVVEVLDGRVTRKSLADALKKDWDIVHFIGHGDLDEATQVRIRLNNETPAAQSKPSAEPAADEEDWVSAQVFAQLFQRSAARLVLLNCCHGGSVSPERADSMLGLGAYLMKARIPAVVVMRYEIGDSAAGDFSRAFYRELLAGPRSGRVDTAVQEGRAALFQTYSDRKGSARSYVTPALYLAENHEQLFAALGIEEPPCRPSEAPAIDPRIPQRLLHAMAAGRCLPVLGPGVLGSEAVRREVVVPGPSRLARKLGMDSEFPDAERINALTDSGSKWLTPVLLHRTCQHFESVDLAERAGLIEAVRRTYRSVEPPQVLERVDTWNVPGIVYAHVDGLLEKVLVRSRGRNLRVLGPEKIGPETAPIKGVTTLVSLRGSYAEAESLVLTEFDEDQQLDRMAMVASFVESVMHLVSGCSLLFAGVSPRDPLVRALARRLLRPDVAKSRGTAYFVTDSSAAADRCYWDQFQKIEWVEMDLGALVDGLSAAAMGAPAADS